MRIRRNPIKPLAIGLTLCLFTPAIMAQETTSTTETKPQAAPIYNLEPGDQLIYKTSGKVSMKSGDQARDEAIDFTTSLTVLEKKADTLTVYAGITLQSDSDKESPANRGGSGPQFTFQLPASGASPEDEFEKAGLPMNPFPTFSVESLFPQASPEGKTTISLAIPVTGAVADGEAITTKDGDNLKTVATLTKETTPVLTRTAIFSPGKSALQSLETSVSVSASARNGNEISFSVLDNTNLESKTKLSPEALEALKKDISAGIPVANKLLDLQNGQPQPDALKSLAADLGKYIKENPQGQFNQLFAGIEKEITAAAERSANWEKVKPGETPADFTATTIDDKTIKLSDHKGKVVLLDFWATWCGPCMMELPNVKKIYTDYKDKGFQIIAISADENIEDLQKIVQQEDIQWPQIFKDAEKIQAQYGVMKFPTTILIDKEGKISAVDLRGDELGDAVKKLIDGNTEKK